MMSEAVLMDNMEYMSNFPTRYFDIGVVDPPYGLKEDGGSNHNRSRLSKPKMYTAKGWDNVSPPQEYFNELFRVSKNQIIWGANHFISKIPYDSSSWIVWDKDNGECDFADCELAWTSFNTAVRRYKFRWAGMLQQNMKNKEIRIHPTQKPVSLYEWIYAKYLPEGGKVIDTHLGSGSNRIAADKAGNIDFYSCENDPEYFYDQEKRYNDYKKQLVIKF